MYVYIYIYVYVYIYIFLDGVFHQLITTGHHPCSMSVFFLNVVGPIH